MSEPSQESNSLFQPRFKSMILMIQDCGFLRKTIIVKTKCKLRILNFNGWSTLCSLFQVHLSTNLRAILLNLLCLIRSVNSNIGKTYLRGRLLKKNRNVFFLFFYEQHGLCKLHMGNVHVKNNYWYICNCLALSKNYCVP